MKVLVVSRFVGFILEETSRLSKRNVEIYLARGLMSFRDKKRDAVVRGVYIRNFNTKIDPSIVPVSMKTIGELPPTTFFYPKSFAAIVPYSWFVTKLAKRHDVDLIHAHFAAPAGFAGLMAKRSTNKPLVVTLHGVDVLTEPSIGYGLRLDPRLEFLVKKVLKEADVVIAGSSATAREAAKICGEPEKLVLIPNGVDLDRFNISIDGGQIRDSLKIDGKPMVFTLRRHVRKNGIEYLIKAARLVLRDKPDVVFVIGGKGRLLREHEKLAKDLGIAQNVIFVGYIPSKDVPRYYAACDLFVMPSVIEAFGIVAVEALACGKPVIGTNVGGVPDIVKDGQNGYLVKPRDPKSLADRIVFLLDNPDLIKKMGIKGREMAEKNFDINNRIDKILSIYSELINR